MHPHKVSSRSWDRDCRCSLVKGYVSSPQLQHAEPGIKVLAVRLQLTKPKFQDLQSFRSSSAGANLRGEVLFVSWVM